MNWSQIVHWAGGHAGVVSIAGVLTLFLSAYTAHALTKSRERLKRIRDYESMSRESMQDRCIGLLDVAEEIRAWVPIHRKKLARLALKGDKTEATALLFEIDAGLTTRAYRVQHAGELAMYACPPELAEHPQQLMHDLLDLLSFALDAEASDAASEAEAAVQSSVQTMFLLIRAIYNLELYDNRDSGGIRSAFKYGLTEQRRRAHRESMPTKVIQDARRRREERKSEQEAKVVSEVAEVDMVDSSG
ncbi:hypothetical protein [Mycobacteroides franklinii]|uniref:hypothetical protein n=1 Tax=Mycobacteroides franklinii TaxID=948102 RepID=UPI0013E8AE0D